MVILKRLFVQSYCVTACSRGARLCRFTMQRTIPFVRFLWEMVYFDASNLWEMEYFGVFNLWEMEIYHYLCTINKYVVLWKRGILSLKIRWPISLPI